MKTLLAGDFVKLKKEIKIIRGLEIISVFPIGSKGRITHCIASDAGYIKMSDSSEFFVHAVDLEEDI